jgi:hypothetical protein
VLPGLVGLRRVGPLLPRAVRQLGVPGMGGPLSPSVLRLMASCARLSRIKLTASFCLRDYGVPDLEVGSLVALTIVAMLLRCRTEFNRTMA